MKKLELQSMLIYILCCFGWLYTQEQPGNSHYSIRANSCADVEQISQGQNGIGVSILVLSPTGATTGSNNITVPGNYIVSDNLFIPAGQHGIIISSDNVDIDLNAHTIQGAVNSLHGIFITNNRSNITIRNGTIRNMGSNGIQINQGSQDVILENIELFQNNNGLGLFSGRTFLIEDCIASQNRNMGFLISQSGSVITQNAIFNHCISSFNGNDGFQFLNCSNFFINSSIAHNNQGNGFDQINGNRFTYSNCLGNSNLLHGFNTTGIDHRFNDCQANNNGGNGYTISGNQHNINNSESKTNGGHGFQITGNNNICNACSSLTNNNTGFVLSGNQQVLEYCQATSNAVNGIQINNNNHCVLNCIMQNNASNGLTLLANSSQCQIRNNTALANGTGFANNTSTANRIYSNFASDNTTANFVGITNVAVSPTAVTAINCTANIEN